MGEALRREIGRADAGQLFNQDHLLHRRRVDAAMLSRPMGRGPALLAERLEPTFKLGRSQAIVGMAQLLRQIGFEPAARLGAKRLLCRRLFSKHCLPVRVFARMGARLGPPLAVVTATPVR
jgi:hypothetical protein